MADKNLARSEPADIGLLSDDDPLAELARIVGYEPRNVPTAARPVPPTIQSLPMSPKIRSLPSLGR